MPSKAPPTWTSRNFENEDDFRQMQAMLMEARLQTDDWHYAHVGELAFAFFMVACHLDPHKHIRLWHSNDKLVGYAILGEDPSFDWQVLPEYKWRRFEDKAGIEEEAMTWAESLLAELRRDDPQQWGEDLVSGARRGHRNRITFLEQHGFRQGGPFSEVNLMCRLNADIPYPEIPSGWQVRSFDRLDDISRRAAAQRYVWQPWTVGNVSDEDYASLMELPGYDRELDVVAVSPGGEIAAYVNGWIDPLNHIGDFGPVGALPAYRRRGFTRAVLLEGLRHMQERDMNRVCVSTGVTNTPALRLYESVGFRIENWYLQYVQSPGK